ncbi:MAG: hypothetical protein IJW29_05460 [Clostridia bacterium]|nr:hypothetical protein [Clostridia bacterium]
MKQHIKYNVAIIALGALALLFVVLALVAILPPRSVTGVSVKETIRVSSSLDGDSKGYRSQLRGVIVNKSNERVKIDRLELVVSNGKDEKQIVLRDIVLAPRVVYDLQNAENEWEDAVAYDRVLSVTVVSGGEREVISNNTVGLRFDLAALLWTVLAVIDGILLVRVSKTRYYLAQEDRMKAE